MGGQRDERAVLLVEDHVGMRQVLRGTIERNAGVRVLEAGTVADATSQLRACRPALVVLDLRLPDGHGADVLSYLRRDLHDEATRVLVLTADTDPAQRELMLQRGADGFLFKSDGATHIAAAVTRLLQPA